MFRPAQKCNACRELRTAGTEKLIPVLAGLLTDAETSHAARFALEAMPYPAAGAALREAAGKATGLTRSGILDSLASAAIPRRSPCWQRPWSTPTRRSLQRRPLPWERSALWRRPAP